MKAFCLGVLPVGGCGFVLVVGVCVVCVFGFALVGVGLVGVLVVPLVGLLGA